MIPFVRNLGYEAGVQLNPLQDRSGITTAGEEDQNLAMAARFTRGRIDKAFAVNQSNVRQRLGAGELIRVNALNEGYVQLREALNRGAYQAIVSRLHTDAAVLSWIVCADDAVTAGAYEFSLSATAPTADYLFALKHMECFNDGIQIEFWADTKRVSGVNAANDVIALRIREPDGTLLDEFVGSLDPAATDDFGNSIYLPDVVNRQTDRYQVAVGDQAALGTTPETYGIATTSDAYGFTDGDENWVSSDVMDYFAENGTTYDAEDYARARTQLYETELGYGYIASGGTQASGLLDALASLAHDTNRQMRFDVPGSLGVDAAIAWIENLAMTEKPSAHLLHAFWCPVKTDCPIGLNGNGYFGTSALNIGFACSRNAVTDNNGFAAKHFGIGGKAWPLARSGYNQVVKPTRQQLSDLAKPGVRINPVLYETYAGGGLYVFRDLLTQAPVENSLKMLIPVVEMSTSIDTIVTRIARESLLLPMDVGIQRCSDALERVFTGAVAAGWMVPSSEPELNGAEYRFEVRANSLRPYDRMDVEYWVRYTGTTRQIHVTQTLTK